MELFEEQECGESWALRQAGSDLPQSMRIRGTSKNTIRQKSGKKKQKNTHKTLWLAIA